MVKNASIYGLICVSLVSFNGLYSMEATQDREQYVTEVQLKQSILEYNQRMQEKIDELSPTYEKFVNSMSKNYENLFKDTEKIRQKCATEKLKAVQMQNDINAMKLFQHSTPGQMQQHANAGFGQTLGSAAAQVVLAPVMMLGELGWDSCKPEHVREREEALSQLQTAMQDLENSFTNYAKKDRYAFEQLDHNKKVIADIECLLQNTPELSQCDFMIQRDKNGKMLGVAFVPKEFYEAHEVLNQVELRATGECIPADEFYKKKLNGLKLQMIQNQFEFIEQQAQRSQVLEEKELVVKELQQDIQALLKKHQHDPPKELVQTLGVAGLKVGAVGLTGYGIYWLAQHMMSSGSSSSSAEAA